MKKFSDFGITTNIQSFTGEKIKIDRILNKQIVIIAYRIESSKHNDGKCLYLQIETSNEKRVLFTGSNVLIDTIQKIPRENFPFETTIIKDSDFLKFT